MSHTGNTLPGQKDWKEQAIEASRQRIVNNDTMRRYREHNARMIEISIRSQNTDGDNTIS